MTTKQVVSRLKQVYQKETGKDAMVQQTWCGYQISAGGRIVVVDVINERFHEAEQRNPHATNQITPFGEAKGTLKALLDVVTV